MKRTNMIWQVTLVLCMVGIKAHAYDIAVSNADGVTIYYNFNSAKTKLTVTYLNSSGGSYFGVVSIPESVTHEEKTYPVTAIRESAFYRCSGLTSVKIPNSVISIGESAFESCSNLRSVEIGNGVKKIANNTFRCCYSLTSVVIPDGVTSIGDCAFLYCSSLASVTIPNSVTWIGGGVFWWCSSLTSVVIPNSVRYIDGFTFNGCSSLTSVTIPNSVTSIEGYAFSGCSSLASITIPNSVTIIERGAFEDCSSLTSVEFGSGMKKIESDAFNNTALKTVRVYATKPPTICYDTFPETYEDDGTSSYDIALYVPEESLATYQEAAHWKNFFSIQGFDTTDIRPVTNNEDEAKPVYYDLSGKRLKTPKKGVNIVTVGGKSKKIFVR